ncbi:hypothetical protein BH23CHL8_BH23CHL8_29450 [soil metagenome]
MKRRKRLKVRWADGPDDAAAPDEALARIEPLSATQETYPGAGRLARRLAYDGTGLRWAGEPEPTDLHVSRVRLRLSVETADGRPRPARPPPAHPLRCPGGARGAESGGMSAALALALAPRSSVVPPGQMLGRLEGLVTYFNPDPPMGDPGLALSA